MKTWLQKTSRWIRLGVWYMLLCIVCDCHLNANSTISGSAIHIGFSPFSEYMMESANDKEAGYGYEYLEKLLQYAPCKYEFTAKGYDWSTMFSKLESGEIDLCFAVPQTPEQVEKFAFSRIPVGYSATILTVRKGENRYRQCDYANWDGIRIGLLREDTRNEAFAAFAAQKGFLFESVFYDSTSSLLEDLRTGRNIDAALTGNLRKLSGEWVYEQFDLAPFYIVVRKDNQSLLAQIDSAMERLSRLSPQTLTMTWNHNDSQNDTEKNLSTSEHSSASSGLRYIFQRFASAYPVLTFGIPSGIFLLIIILSSRLLFLYRKMARRSEIIKLLPLRYFVADTHGKILLYALGNEPELFHGKLRTLDDLPDQKVNRIMAAAMPGVLKSGKSISVEFEFNHQRRTAAITPLPVGVFRRPAAIWISQDTTELLQAKDVAEANAAQLQLTLCSIGDGVLVTDPDGNITMLNPVAEKMMGCTLADAQGKAHTDWFKIVSALDQWPTSSPLLRSLRTGEIVEMANHTDLLSGNGARYHIADSSAPIKNKDGELIGGILIFRDVTEDYEQRYALRNLNTLLTSVTDNLPAEFFLKDVENDFRYLQVNWGLPELLHLTPEQIVGKNDFDLFPVAHAERLRQDDLAALQNSQRTETITRYRGDDNTVIYFHFYRKVITNANGNRLLLGVVINITEQETQKREVEQQKIELAQYNKKLQQFIRQDEVLNQCFEEVMVNDDFSTVFRKLADIIGTQLHATTVLIDRYRAGNPAYFEALECWQPPENTAEFRYDVISERDFPAMFAYLKQGGFVHFSNDACNAQNLTPWQIELCRYFKESGMREIICVPLIRNQVLWGYLGAEVKTAEQSFESVGERMMTSAAHFMSILLQREDFRTIQRRTEGEKLMILNVMPVPVVLLDSDYQVLQANSAALRMVGGTLDEYVGHTCYSTVCHRANRDATCPIWLTLHTGKAQSMERRINDRIYMVNTMPLWHDGEVQRVLKVYIDITEITHTRELLQEAVAQAEAAAQSKSQFLATMSHEIRTPLNAVVGFSELLQDTEMSENERREYLHSINLAGNALLNLINDILDLSKIEAKQMPLSLRPGKFEELIQEIQAIFQHRLADKNLFFKVICATELPVLMLDFQRMRQVLLNLVGNAIKFTYVGTITVETSFERVNDATGTLKIVVADTGIGIGETYQQHIFEPFVQEETRDTHNQSGTGLGLAIVKRLVENMGGQIELFSVVNQGSRFSITLPVQIGSTDEGSLNLAHTNVLHTSSARILIVDDVAMNLKVLGAMLKKIGCEFEATTSPMQALALLAQGRFDVVLTDLWMPEMNGSELARKIKVDYPEIAIYATTADVDGKESFDMRVFDGVVIKPLSLQKLQELFAATDK